MSPSDICLAGVRDDHAVMSIAVVNGEIRTEIVMNDGTKAHFVSSPAMAHYIIADYHRAITQTDWENKPNIDKLRELFGQ